MITIEQARLVLQTVDAGLVSGIGEPVPGHMCVEAAVCYALGLPHGDDPPCVARSVRRPKIAINDAFRSDAKRTREMRALSLLQLGTAGALDEQAFATKLVMLAVNKYVPIALRLFSREAEAMRCERASSLAEAESAALAAAGVSAAGWAAAAAAAAKEESVEEAAYAAVTAALAAAEDAAAAVRERDRDETLTMLCRDIESILIGMGVPGVEFLPLLEEVA